MISRVMGYGLWVMGLFRVKRPISLIFISVIILSLFFVGSTSADEKQWGGGGDGVSWEDLDNWSPAAIPALSDAVTISAANAEVVASETFSAKSITVGGRGAANFTSSDFVYGTITPLENTDNALFIRKDGLVTMKGTGDITLKGALKNSEETLVNEPSFMFQAS